MAVIGKIRNRSGLLIGIVGLAMVVFVGGDLLKGNGNFFSQPDTDVGEIDGQKISYLEFDNRVNEISEGQSVAADQLDQVRNQVWNQLLQEVLVETEYAKLGISVTSEEVWEEIRSNPRNAILVQYFTNPQDGQIYEQLRSETTGGLDNQKVMFYIKQILNSETPESWYPVEKAIMKTLLSNKYNNAIKKGLFVTTFDAEQKSAEDNKRIAISYAGMKYSDISDDEITIEESDITAYYNAHKNEADFKQTETNRGTKLVVWNVNPSEEDIRSAETEITGLIESFKVAENDTLFMVSNSDDRNGIQTVGRYEMPAEVDSILFNSENGTVMGPYSIGGAFRISKKLQTKMMSDSVRARHILIQPSAELDTAAAEARIDSLKDAIKRGADFGELAKEFSADLGSGREGGDLNWFTQGQMVPEFNEACFNGKVGDMPIVFTQFGYHLIEITDKTDEREKVDVISVTKLIEASDETYEKLYNKASEFSIQNGTLDEFIAAADEDPELNVQDFEFVKEGDKVLGSIENPRTIIRWIYESNIGDVSDVYEMGNQFIVAAVSSVKNKGVLPLEEVRDRVEEEVRKEKKAEVILAKIGDSEGVDGIAAALGQSVQSANDLTFSSFSIPGIGPEAKVLGVVFGFTEGEETDVLQGENGVYVIRIDRITPADGGNLDITKDQIARNFSTRVDYEVFEALKDRGNVVDNRHKFY